MAKILHKLDKRNYDMLTSDDIQYLMENYRHLSKKHAKGLILNLRNDQFVMKTRDGNNMLHLACYTRNIYLNTNILC